MDSRTVTQDSYISGDVTWWNTVHLPALPLGTIEYKQPEKEVKCPQGPGMDTPKSAFSTRGNFAQCHLPLTPRGLLALSGDIFDLHTVMGKSLASGEQSPEMLRNIWHCTEHPLMMKNYWAPNVNSAEVDKFCLKCSLSRELKSHALWQSRGMGVRFMREGTYVYLCLINVHVWHKTAKHCKAINLQLKWSKFKLKKKKKLFPKFPRCWVKLTTELNHRVNEFGESFLPFPNLGSFSRQLLNKLLKMSSLLSLRLSR